MYSYPVFFPVSYRSSLFLCFYRRYRKLNGKSIQLVACMFHNLYFVLPRWYYFFRVTHLEFHDDQPTRTAVPSDDGRAQGLFTVTRIVTANRHPFYVFPISTHSVICQPQCTAALPWRTCCCRPFLRMGRGTGGLKELKNREVGFLGGNIQEKHCERDESGGLRYQSIFSGPSLDHCTVN